MSTRLKVTEFNDPGCPFGYSSEIKRRRVEWLYGDAIEIDLRLVGLTADPDEPLKWGFTVEKLAAAWGRLAEQHGMPFDLAPLARHSATVPACRAVVAAREHGAGHRRLMRWLRIKRFSGEPIDDRTVIDDAARQAGIDPADLAGWEGDDVTEEALGADLAAARSPDRAALALDHKLAGWDGGRRYSCPSWEIDRVGGARTVVPGFQPWEVYEVALANLLPEAELQDTPDDAAVVLEWAGEPLATREVATVMQIGDAEAAAKLVATGAREIKLDTSSFWATA